MPAPSHRDALDRIRHEYRELPGLSLTASQIQRLCGVDEIVCEAVLDALVAADVLRLTSTGRYISLGIDPWGRRRMLKADLPLVPRIPARGPAQQAG